ncbi:VPLPA-CTERM sorting domain-containing protein [uncultured Roseobacter sp.]|uniref:VPLPA-CTERM sorting domain-containing protein n=1 Tax=uncultured Roseobacter sp. TaxID=114847 RepID=UPI00260AD40D|nr:VPLPA-CTERM sorting domain-containing protein [uncultured Roseobacter sp.]
MRRSLLILGAVSLLPLGAQAATYQQSGIVLETETRQSAWGPGDAARLDDTIFIGPDPWSESETFGGFVGGATSITYPNPKHIAWKACRLIPFIGSKCGREPAKNLTTKLDTTTGAQASISSSGRAGLELSYALDAGSVGSRLEYVAHADVPGTTLKKGQTVSLTTTAELVSGTLDSQSPTAEASIDVVADIQVDVSTTGCAVGACTSGSKNLINVDGFRKELISIDPTEINYLDGFLPDLVELSTPIGDVPTSLEADLVTRKLDFNTNVNNDTGAPGDPDDPKTKKENIVDSTEPGSGLFIELARVDAKVPLLELNGVKEDGKDEIVVDGKADFLALRADIDGLLTYAGALPPLGIRADFGKFVSGSIDLIDIETGPKIDVFQTFRLTQDLMVDLSFDKQVDIAGIGLTKSWTGLWEELPDFSLIDTTIATPTFFTQAMLHSTTGFDFGADFNIDLLKGNLTVGTGGVNAFEGSFGPVFKTGGETSFGRVALFDEIFALGGFSMFEGEAMTFRVGEIVLPSQVPLPAGAWLLLGGLAGLGVMRKAQKRA